MKHQSDAHTTGSVETKLIYWWISALKIGDIEGVEIEQVSEFGQWLFDDVDHFGRSNDLSAGLHK